MTRSKGGKRRSRWLLGLKPGLLFPIKYQVVFGLSGLLCTVHCAFCPFFADGLLSVSLVLAGFGDQPTPQQLHMQNRYKEDLKRQVSPGLQPLVEASHCLHANGGNKSNNVTPFSLYLNTSASPERFEEVVNELQMSHGLFLTNR